MQIIKVNTKDMNPEKAINYLITHAAWLKGIGKKETVEAVEMGISSLRAWIGAEKELEEIRQEYIETYDDDSLEVFDRICDIIVLRAKRMVEDGIADKN